MFSGAIKITNIDDYILPSKDCIFPITQQAAKKQEGFVAQDNIMQSSENQVAKVTLQDCLACTGCITSAETILLEQQNVDQILESLKTDKITVLSLSPQSRASLSYYYNLNDFQTQIQLTKYFNNLGVNYIFDMNSILDYTVNLAAQEFIERQKLFKNNSEQKYLKTLLCSECPGWICYAEKTVEAFIIDVMSHTKTPQQIFGIFMKKILAELNGKNENDIYHISVQPCYDKKLEIYRKSKNENIENYNKDIDLALATQELIKFIEQEDLKLPKEQQFMNLNIDFSEQLYYQNFDNILDYYNQKIIQNNQSVIKKEYILYKNAEKNNVSNAYIENIIYTSAKELFQLNESQIIIEEKQGKNQDIVEYKVFNDKKKLLWTFAKLYGLRNIQNLIRNLKNKVFKYDYIEIMACPGGCINGGGQQQPKDKEMKIRQFAQEVTQVLNGSDKILRKKDQNQTLEIFKQIINNYKINEQDSLYVQFQHRDKTEIPPQLIKW